MQASAVTTTVLGSGKSVGNPMKYKGMYVRYGLEPGVWILVQVWFGCIPLASKKSTSWPPSWPVWAPEAAQLWGLLCAACHVLAPSAPRPGSSSASGHGALQGNYLRKEPFALRRSSAE